MPEVSKSAVLMAGMPQAPIGEKASLMYGPVVGHVAANDLCARGNAVPRPVRPVVVDVHVDRAAELIGVKCPTLERDRVTAEPCIVEVADRVAGARRCGADVDHRRLGRIQPLQDANQ